MAFRKIQLPHEEAATDHEVISMGENHAGQETLLVVDPADNSTHVVRVETDAAREARLKAEAEADPAAAQNLAAEEQARRDAAELADLRKERADRLAAEQAAAGPGKVSKEN